MPKKGVDGIKDILAAIILIGSAGTVIWKFGKATKKVMDSASSMVTSVQELKADSEKQREQTRIMTRALFVVLDGLQQVGANGNVTKMHKELETYLVNQLR
jgi:hypothetical protein